MSSSPTEKSDVVSLETKLNELEKIVSTMETGNLPLEKALDQFEQGIKYVKDCEKLLNDAETRINKLTQESEKDNNETND